MANNKIQYNTQIATRLHVDLTENIFRNPNQVFS